MRALAGVAALCLVLMAASGCYTAPVMPPLGAIYADIKAPLTTEAEKPAVTDQRGEASTQSILGLVAWGDCSLDTAAKNGKLSTIEYADYSYMNVALGIYQKFTVVVHGK
jgi:hypothetical protein